MTSNTHILLTGANGYIGRRLLPVLLEKGYRVTCLVRDQRRFKVSEENKDSLQVAEADLLKPETLENLPKDIDAAYFLVHSMSASYRNFEELEAQTAHNFSRYVDTTACKQVVFLSGIMNDPDLSRHFQSRKNVEEILKNGKTPVTILRAAIIIGSGSASFEIMRDLVNKLPVMVAPKWLKNKIQPIALRDVLFYLSEALFLEKSYQQTYDIGGPEILTYRSMLMKMARIKGKKRWIINVPVLTPKLSAYWLYFVTATSFTLARSLVESLKHEVLVKHKGIEQLLPKRLIPFEEAVKLANDRINERNVASSWKDSLVSGTIRNDFLDQHEVPLNECFVDEQRVTLEQPVEQVKANIWQIGGEKGWYYLDSLWRLRGIMDKMVGGVGLRRGRRSPVNLANGDALDFWRVLKADKAEGYLLLYAEMKLPGEAWLEFKIFEGNGSKPTLMQRASFKPNGWWGKMYWYASLPAHLFIFKGMADKIGKKLLT